MTDRILHTHYLIGLLRERVPLKQLPYQYPVFDRFYKRVLRRHSLFKTLRISFETFHLGLLWPTKFFYSDCFAMLLILPDFS